MFVAACAVFAGACSPCFSPWQSLQSGPLMCGAYNRIWPTMFREIAAWHAAIRVLLNGHDQAGLTCTTPIVVSDALVHAVLPPRQVRPLRLWHRRLPIGHRPRKDSSLTVRKMARQVESRVLQEPPSRTREAGARRS